MALGFAHLLPGSGRFFFLLPHAPRTRRLPPPCPVVQVLGMGSFLDRPATTKKTEMHDGPEGAFVAAASEMQGWRNEMEVTPTSVPTCHAPGRFLY